MLGSAAPLTDEQLRKAPVSVAARPAAIAAADILCGTATAPGAVIIDLPAGRTWHGVVTLSAVVRVASGGAAVNAVARVDIGGVGVVPPAGTYLRLNLSAPASAVGGNGTVDSGQISTTMTIITPAVNSISLILNTTDTTMQSASANGQLL